MNPNEKTLCFSYHTLDHFIDSRIFYFDYFLVGFSFCFKKKVPSHAVSEPRASVPKKESPPSLPPPRPPKKESPRPPLPREVEWSVLSNKLIEMEKQCNTLITTLLPHFPPEVEEEMELASPLTLEPPPPTPKPPSSQVTWAQVGNQLIELEKKREQMIILFIDRGTHEVSQP